MPSRAMWQSRLHHEWTQKCFHQTFWLKLILQTDNSIRTNCDISQWWYDLFVFQLLLHSYHVVCVCVCTRCHVTTANLTLLVWQSLMSHALNSLILMYLISSYVPSLNRPPTNRWWVLDLKLRSLTKQTTTKQMVSTWCQATFPH